MARYFKSSLLEGAEAIPEGDYNDENIHSTVVPFRNGIMLAIAAGLAESRELTRVMMANHFGDHVIYPDCSEEFVRHMSSAMTAGTYVGVQVLAPYTTISKTDIARIGKRLGIDYSLTYSCYKGGPRHCGRCATCRERMQALREAGIDDHTDYEE